MAMSTAAGAKRVRQAFIITTAVALLIVVGASPTLAAKGGVKGGAAPSSSSVVIPDGVFGGTTVATASPAVAGTFVEVYCYQNGSMVMAATQSVDSNGQTTIQLGPTPLWSSGAATCTGAAGQFDAKGNFVTSASTSFSVSAN